MYTYEKITLILSVLTLRKNWLIILIGCILVSVVLVASLIYLENNSDQIDNKLLLDKTETITPDLDDTIGLKSWDFTLESNTKILGNITCTSGKIHILLETLFDDQPVNTLDEFTLEENENKFFNISIPVKGEYRLSATTINTTAIVNFRITSENN